MTFESVPRRRAQPAAAIFAAAASALLLAACGSAPKVRPAPSIPPVTSTAQASEQLAAVARERAAIESRYADREAVCYTKFFVNNCLDEAKDIRRNALVVQRAIEVQAERFQRAAIVEERDRQVAVAEQRYQEQEARLAAEPPKPPPEVKPAPAPRTPTGPGRVAQHNAREQAARRQDAADTGKRAENVRAYEARKADSEERQRRVAQRKADRAAKDAKDAADKAKAAQQAAQSGKPGQ